MRRRVVRSKCVKSNALQRTSRTLYSSIILHLQLCAMASCDILSDVAEELEALKSIYCEPGEFDVYFSGVDGQESKVMKQVKATCSAQSCTSTITMILTLPLGYPDIPPKISLIARDFDNEILTEMKDDVENHAQLLLGQPMLMNLIMKLEESVSSCMLSSRISCSSCVKAQQKSQEVGTMSDRASEESTCWTTLLQIDHMRSKSSYVKTLSHWTKELDLFGRLVFYDWLILLLLQGDLKDIQVFVSRLRTVNVDVDSRGRSCKERMLKILAEPQLLSNPRCLRFTTFSVITLTSWKAVEELFHEHGLEKLYFDYVNTLKSR